MIRLLLTQTSKPHWQEYPWDQLFRYQTCDYHCKMYSFKYSSNIYSTLKEPFCLIEILTCPMSCSSFFILFLPFYQFLSLFTFYTFCFLNFDFTLIIWFKTNLTAYWFIHQTRLFFGSCNIQYLIYFQIEIAFYHEPRYFLLYQELHLH